MLHSLTFDPCQTVITRRFLSCGKSSAGRTRSSSAWGVGPGPGSAMTLCLEASGGTERGGGFYSYGRRAVSRCLTGASRCMQGNFSLLWRKRHRKKGTDNYGERERAADVTTDLHTRSHLCSPESPRSTSQHQPLATPPPVMSSQRFCPDN